MLNLVNLFSSCRLNCCVKMYLKIQLLPETSIPKLQFDCKLLKLIACIVRHTAEPIINSKICQIEVFYDNLTSLL